MPPQTPTPDSVVDCLQKLNTEEKEILKRVYLLLKGIAPADYPPGTAALSTEEACTLITSLHKDGKNRIDSIILEHGDNKPTQELRRKAARSTLISEATNLLRAVTTDRLVDTLHTTLFRLNSREAIANAIQANNTIHEAIDLAPAPTTRPPALTGLPNIHGASCWLNSTIHTLRQLPNLTASLELAEGLYDIPLARALLELFNTEKPEGDDLEVILLAYDPEANLVAKQWTAPEAIARVMSNILMEPPALNLRSKSGTEKLANHWVMPPPESPEPSTPQALFNECLRRQDGVPVGEAPAALIAEYPRTTALEVKSKGAVDFDSGRARLKIGADDYEIQSILLHHGDNPNYGHYTIVSHDDDGWRHYNDDQAEPMNRISDEQKQTWFQIEKPDVSIESALSIEKKLLDPELFEYTSACRATGHLKTPEETYQKDGFVWNYIGTNAVQVVWRKVNDREE